MSFRPLIRYRKGGLSLGRCFLRPGLEAWRAPWGRVWYAQAFGACLWWDATPLLTVAERGVW